MCKYNKIFCNNNDCAECFEKSFASHSKAKYWSDKNTESPRHIVKSSHKKYWFNCNNCNHEITVSLDNIIRGSWCPYCSIPSKKLCNDNNCNYCFQKSFASHEKSKYWSEKNNCLPRNIFKTSNSKYIFLCSCKSEFELDIYNIAYKNQWCICCSNSRLCSNNECKQCFNKSFASHEKAKYWSDKNTLNPRDITICSGQKFIFNCDCGHEFIPRVADITYSNQWCPYCSIPTKKLCNDTNCKNCFEKSFASHQKSKYWSEKNNCSPRTVCKSSNSKYIFLCSCGHEFDSTLSHINGDRWCPYCFNKKLCNNNDCKICFEKSFASHEKSKYWSEKNKINPRDIFKSTPIQYYFICSCNHELLKSPNQISKSWCPYCSTPPQLLCDDNNCKNCFNNSFASHEKSQYWSNLNLITPRTIFKGTHKNYFFNCNKCSHVLDICINAITSSDSHWCSYCTNQILCNTDDCIECYNKSFASHEKSKYWSNQNSLKPREVFKGSDKKIYFNCENNHSFISRVANVSKLNRWCPYCVNKTELKLYESLIEYYPTLERQFKVEWCKKINKLPFDFVIKDKNIIIELDGPQHFEQVMDWSPPEEQQKNDIYKMKCAIDNNFSVIRILQTDVFDDKYNWLEELINNINHIKSKEIIYMCKNDEYVVYT